MKWGQKVKLGVVLVALGGGLWGSSGASAGESADARMQALEAKVKLLESRLQNQGQEVKKIRQLEKKITSLPKTKVSDSTINMKWKDGLRMKSNDGSFKLKFGGRVMNDWVWVGEDNAIRKKFGDQERGTEFRRARLYMAGTIYDNVFFKAQYDFAGGDADFKDVYIGLKEIPGIGHVKIGHFKEPFSLDELTSSKYIMFMERALPSVFAPGRNTGVSVYNTALDKRLTWAVGFFNNTGAYGDSRTDQGLSVTGRVTGLPWYEEKGAHLLHLGLAYSHRTQDDDTIRYRERPEVHLADRFVNTGHFDAETVNLFGAEAALVFDSFSLQSEFVYSDVNSGSTNRDPNFWSAYAQASYFLTGEHRAYKKKSGTFSRVHPYHNLGKDGGIGAWELALRYSALDLDDELVAGGRLDNFSAGVNWYLNPNTRVMFNYVRADLDTVGDANSFMMRFQIDF